MSHETRSEALIEVLSELAASDIGFVLVGGYAISQYETRFSTDLDLVIAPADHEAVVAFLEELDFERVNQFDVPPAETKYGRSVELFERSQGLPHPVGVDVLVNGLGCRQTEAEWSFDYLRTHSSETTIAGETVDDRSNCRRGGPGRSEAPQRTENRPGRRPRRRPGGGVRRGRVAPAPR